MLCDKHPASLVVTRVQYNGMELESFRCIQPGCTRHYNSAVGYFDVVRGRPLHDKFQQECPNCGTPMFRATLGINTEETWRCPLSQCQHEQRILASLDDLLTPDRAMFSLHPLDASATL